MRFGIDIGEKHFAVGWFINDVAHYKVCDLRQGYCVRCESYTNTMFDNMFTCKSCVKKAKINKTTNDLLHALYYHLEQLPIPTHVNIEYQMGPNRIMHSLMLATAMYYKSKGISMKMVHAKCKWTFVNIPMPTTYNERKKRAIEWLETQTLYEPIPSHIKQDDVADALMLSLIE